MDSITFVSIYRQGSTIPLSNKVALRYDSKKEQPESVALGFFQEQMKEHKRTFGSGLYFYEFYEREDDKFVLMYRSL